MSLLLLFAGSGEGVPGSGLTGNTLPDLNTRLFVALRSTYVGDFNAMIVADRATRTGDANQRFLSLIEDASS